MPRGKSSWSRIRTSLRARTKTETARERGHTAAPSTEDEMHKRFGAVVLAVVAVGVMAVPVGANSKPPPSTAQLEAKLLQLSDMPTGWAGAATDPATQTGSACGGPKLGNDTVGVRLTASPKDETGTVSGRADVILIRVKGVVVASSVAGLTLAGFNLGKYAKLGLTRLDPLL